MYFSSVRAEDIILNGCLGGLFLSATIQLLYAVARG